MFGVSVAIQKGELWFFTAASRMWENDASS